MENASFHIQSEETWKFSCLYLYYKKPCMQWYSGSVIAYRYTLCTTYESLLIRGEAEVEKHREMWILYFYAHPKYIDRNVMKRIEWKSKMIVVWRQ